MSGRARRPGGGAPGGDPGTGDPRLGHAELRDVIDAVETVAAH